VCSDQTVQNGEVVSDTGELSALVASMNTVCSANPVLVGGYQRIFILFIALTIRLFELQLYVC